MIDHTTLVSPEKHRKKKKKKKGRKKKSSFDDNQARLKAQQMTRFTAHQVAFLMCLTLSSEGTTQGFPALPEGFTDNNYEQKDTKYYGIGKKKRLC